MWGILWSFLVMIGTKIDWSKVTDISLDCATQLAKLTETDADDKAVEIMKNVDNMVGLLNMQTLDLNTKSKKVLAEKLNANSSIIPDINVEFNEKEGFKVSSKFSF